MSKDETEIIMASDSKPNIKIKFTKVRYFGWGNKEPSDEAAKYRSGYNWWLWDTAPRD